MVLFVAEVAMLMPAMLLRTLAVPAALVPILFPCTTLPLVPGSRISTPLPPLPEITLPAPATAPPIVLFEPPAYTRMPWPALGRGAPPVSSVPMKLPWMRMLEALLSRMPSPLPEMMLRSSGVVPPMVWFAVKLSAPRPATVLGMASVPAALVPILFPRTRVPVVPAPPNRRPVPLLPEITLPAFSAVPPITVFVFDVPKMTMPWLVLPRSALPFTSVPM